MSTVDLKEELLNLSKRYFKAAQRLKFHQGEKAGRCHDLSLYLFLISMTLQTVEGNVQRAINWCEYQEKYFRDLGYMYRARMYERVTERLKRLLRVGLPADLDLYMLKADAMGIMYSYRDRKKYSMPGITFRESAAATVLYRCLENSTSVWTNDPNRELLDNLDYYEEKYPRITVKARRLLEELLEAYKGE